jgi:nucleotide-binding universal stress UspA family protein
MKESVIRVLVALDGSPASESVLAAIMPLVRKGPVELMLLEVTGRSGEEEAAAREYLERAREALGIHGVGARIRAVAGRAADKIVELGRPPEFDLVALTTRGSSGLNRMILGSVAGEVLRRAEVPVIANRPGTRVGDWNRLVVALDGTPEGETILSDAIALARMLGSTLHVTRVALPLLPLGEYRQVPAYRPPSEDPMPYLTGVCDRLAREGLLAVADPREGWAGGEIVSLSAELNAGLILMATEGRTGFRRVVAPSVAEDVVRRAPCPVLVRRVSTKPAAGFVGRELPASR